MWPSASHNWPGSKTFYLIPGLRQFFFPELYETFRSTHNKAQFKFKFTIHLLSAFYCGTRQFTFLVSSFLEFFRRGLNKYVMHPPPPPPPTPSPKIGLAIQGIHNTNQSNYSGVKQYSNPAFPPLTVAICPVVIKTMAHFLINRRHGLHVTLPPISP